MSVVTLHSDPYHPYVVYNPECWLQLGRRIGINDPSLAMLFSHELKSADGHTAVVILVARRGIRFIGPAFWAKVIEGSALSGHLNPTTLKVTMSESDSLLLGLSDEFPNNLETYLGKADPVDPSHFEVPFVLGDCHGILDGRFGSHEAISLSIRDPDSCREAIRKYRASAGEPPLQFLEPAMIGSKPGGRD